MEKYISKYKGAEIDAALDLANSALQPGSLTNYALKSQITELQQSINNKADLNGSAPDLIAGAAMSILRTRTSEDIEYSNEYIPAARMLVHAPDCTDRFGSELHVDDSFYPVIQEVAGVSSGSDQMVKNADFSEGTNDWRAGGTTTITAADNTITSKIVTAQSYCSINKVGQTWQTPGHKAMALVALRPKTSKPCYSRLSIFGFGNQGTVELRQNEWNYNSAIGTIGSVTWMEAYCQSRSGNFEVGDSADYKYFHILDLILLPQLPTTFVNSLGHDDAPKVLHKLGISSFTINP